MKKLILILIALPCLALEHPLSIGGHTLNFYNSEPTEIVDRSGNGNDGTVYGTTLGNDGGNNVVGSFDGVDDYVDVGSVGDYTNNFTISCWFKTTGGSYLNMVSRRSGAVSYAFYISSGTLELYNGTGGGSAVVGGDDGNWHLGTVVFQETVLTGYYDGAYAFHGACVNTRSPYSTFIGRWQYGGFFGGGLDNVLFWDKPLENTNVAMLYTAGRTATKGAISTNGLAAFYDFNPPVRALSITNSL